MKVIGEEGTHYDVIIAVERPYQFTKVADSNKAAQDWWKEHLDNGVSRAKWS